MGRFVVFVVLVAMTGCGLTLAGELVASDAGALDATTEAAFDAMKSIRALIGVLAVSGLTIG